MATFEEALKAGAKAAFCTLSGPIEKTLQLGEGIYENANFPGFPEGPTPGGQGLRAMRNVLCNDPQDSVDGLFNPLLPNGQCPGTSYSVSADIELNGNSPIFAGSGTGVGPLRRDKAPNDPEGERDIIYDATGKFLTGGGTSFPDGTADLVNIQITPVSGPDDCGASPPVPPEPYNPPDFTATPDITYVNNEGVDVTVPVGLVFAPVKVDVDGTVTVPFTLELAPEINLGGNIDLSTGDVNVGINVRDTNITTSTDVTVYDDPDGPTGIPLTPTQELQRTIIGVYVEITGIEPSFRGTQLGTNTPNAGFYVPRMGSISFLCDVLSTAGAVWTEDIDVKYTKQLVECPISWGARDVVVTLQNGISGEVTIIRGASSRQLLLRSAGLA